MTKMAMIFISLIIGVFVLQFISRRIYRRARYNMWTGYITTVIGWVQLLFLILSVMAVCEFAILWAISR